MVWITAESVTSAITLSVPPHSGQTDISISKTRLSRSAQLRGAVGKSRSTADSAEAGVAGFFRFLCAGFAEPGTTALLNGETEADYCPKNGPRGGSYPPLVMVGAALTHWKVSYGHWVNSTTSCENARPLSNSTLAYTKGTLTPSIGILTGMFGQQVEYRNGSVAFWLHERVKPLWK